MKVFLTTSRNQQPVYIDYEATKVALHVQETPHLLDLVKEVIVSETLEGENVAIEKDLGRIVGETTLVETTDADEIVYAQRLGREKYTRFVMHKAAQPTRYVTVILHNIDNVYYLWSAWCGQLVPTAPGGSDEMPKSQGFWKNHALVFDETIIQQGSAQTICPWT